MRLRRQGHWDQSLQTLRTALRLEPSNLAVLCEIGLVLLDGGQLADAIATLRRVIRLAPDNVVAHYHLGFALERRGNTAEAAAAYRKVVELSPQFSGSVARLAEALTDLDRCDEAVAVLTEAAERTTGTAARLHRAHARSLSGRYSDAEAELRAALTADPGNREIMLRLGKMQRMRGNFEHARATFHRILERELAGPGPGSYFIKSGRFAAADRKLLDRLVGLLDGGGWAVNDRMGLQFAVGKAFDDLNDHARAMQAFEAANEIRARFWPCDRAGHERRFARQQTLFSAEALAGHRGLGTDDARPIFIVGMPRSGTTLVEQFCPATPTWRRAGSCNSGASKDPPGAPPSSATRQPAALRASPRIIARC